MTHPLLFRDFGDKGAYFAMCTQADFNTRMGPSETDGCLFWATDENVLALDTEYAMSRHGKGSKSNMKVDFHMLLSTQNGWRFGPVSTKGGKQIIVRTTNFGMFHCGQPKCIHQYWGQALVAGSPLNDLGHEARPIFFSTALPQSRPDMVTVPKTGAILCCKALWLCTAARLGHAQNTVNPLEQPMLTCLDAGNPSAQMWSHFSAGAEASKEVAPLYAHSVIGKHCFTTASHVCINHAYACAFVYAKSLQPAELKGLLDGNEVVMRELVARPLEPYFLSIGAEHVVQCPAHLTHNLYNIVAVRNEMLLPETERFEAERLIHADAALPDPTGVRLTKDERLMVKILQRYRTQREISVTDAAASGSKLRGNQAAVQRLFDAAQAIGAGMRVGTADSRGNERLRFVLNLNNMPEHQRQRYKIHVGSGLAPGHLRAYGSGVLVDLGGEFAGCQDACFAVHAVASLSLCQPQPHDLLRGAMMQAAALHTSGPLLLEFGCGIPPALHCLHEALLQVGFMMPVLCCEDFAQSHRAQPVSVGFCLGDERCDRVLQPLLVSARAQHCVLWLQLPGSACAFGRAHRQFVKVGMKRSVAKTPDRRPDVPDDSPPTRAPPKRSHDATLACGSSAEGLSMPLAEMLLGVLQPAHQPPSAL